MSTNSAIGAFTAVAQFEVRRPGATVIYAEISASESLQAYGYRMGLDGTLRQIGVIRLSVHRTGGGILPQVRVEFEPETGEPQSCETRTPPPNTGCWFWTDFSPAVVRASRAGFTSVERAVRPAPRGGFGLEWPFEILLTLSPLDFP